MNGYWLLKKQIKWNKNDDNVFSPPCTVFFHNFPHDYFEETARYFGGYCFTQHVHSTAVKYLQLFDTIH